MESTVKVGEVILCTAPNGNAGGQLVFTGMEEGAQYEVLSLYFVLATSAVVNNRVPSLGMSIGGIRVQTWTSTAVQAASLNQVWSVLPNAIQVAYAGNVVQGCLPQMTMPRNGVKRLFLEFLDGDATDVVTFAAVVLRKLEWRD